MSQATADIFGPTHANFTFTISSGTPTGAFLRVRGNPEVPLTVDSDAREISVPDLPTADSQVRLDIVWGDADPDAVIDVGKDPSGTVHTPDPKHTLDSGETPAFVKLFGIGG